MNRYYSFLILIGIGCLFSFPSFAGKPVGGDASPKRARHESGSPLTPLPRDLLKYLLSFSHMEDLSWASGSCRRLHEVVADIITEKEKELNEKCFRHYTGVRALTENIIFGQFECAIFILKKHPEYLLEKPYRMGSTLQFALTEYRGGTRRVIRYMLRRMTTQQLIDARPEELLKLAISKDLLEEAKILLEKLPTGWKIPDSILTRYPDQIRILQEDRERLP